MMSIERFKYYHGCEIKYAPKDFVLNAFYAALEKDHRLGLTFEMAKQSVNNGSIPCDIYTIFSYTGYMPK